MSAAYTRRSIKAGLVAAVSTRRSIKTGLVAGIAVRYWEIRRRKMK